MFLHFSFHLHVSLKAKHVIYEQKTEKKFSNVFHIAFRELLFTLKRLGSQTVRECLEQGLFLTNHSWKKEISWPDLQSYRVHVQLWPETWCDTAPHWEPNIQICSSTRMPPDLIKHLPHWHFLRHPLWQTAGSGQQPMGSSLREVRGSQWSEWIRVMRDMQRRGSRMWQQLSVKVKLFRLRGEE